MSYDPTDCELGVCGPCDACREQMNEEPDSEAEFVELGDQIPEAQVSVAKKTPIGTIDLTPSWRSIVGLYLEMLERPEISAAKRWDMKDEILRAAKLADLYVKEHKR